MFKDLIQLCYAGNIRSLVFYELSLQSGISHWSFNASAGRTRPDLHPVPFNALGVGNGMTSYSKILCPTNHYAQAHAFEIIGMLDKGWLFTQGKQIMQPLLEVRTEYLEAALAE